ncbi:MULTISPECIES: peptidoglycan-binding protein [unclassified Duganella]|uniref:peptidoglycan-binding protein n=1 Tax=unclassified Duganella TaxID=2636909 RepID=UPI00131445CE|nr:MULTISPECIES: peptidoglycan-binding protein [unclassified Duganella]
MFTIPDARLQALSRASRDQFIDRLMDRLRCDFPATAGDLGSDELHRRVDQAIERAAGFQLLSQQQAGRYINLAAVYGWEFDRDPALSWMRAILTDTILPRPEERLDRLMETCLHRQRTEEHNRLLHRQLGWAPAMAAGTTAPPDHRGLPLAEADQAARAHHGHQIVGAVAMPCPGAGTGEDKLMEIVVTGDDDAGLDGIDLMIVRGDGQVLTGKTGPTGRYRFTGLPPGNYKLCLPALDADAWGVKTIRALPDTASRGTGKATWTTAPDPAPQDDKRHLIVPGECIGKIAEYYGFFPRTIWDHPANADLKHRRHDNMYVLFEGDVVAIPAKRMKLESVAAGDQVIVQRRGVPEHLRIRFLDHMRRPRAGVPYFLSVATDSGIPVPDVLGETDAGGFVDQPIAPSAIHATIILQPGPMEEVHEFDIGYVDPIDTVSGWLARLNNLGYGCGIAAEEDGILIDAVKAFQRKWGLAETGIMDEPTRGRLLQAHGS